MPAFCVASNCEYRYAHSENISFHKFPLHNPELLKKWVEFTDRGESWQPTRWSSICSRHFLPSDFREYLSRRCLKRIAVPSVTIKSIDYGTININLGYSSKQTNNKSILTTKKPRQYRNKKTETITEDSRQTVVDEIQQQQQQPLPQSQSPMLSSPPSHIQSEMETTITPAAADTHDVQQNTIFDHFSEPLPQHNFLLQLDYPQVLQQQQQQQQQHHQTQNHHNLHQNYNHPHHQQQQQQQQQHRLQQPHETLISKNVEFLCRLCAGIVVHDPVLGSSNIDDSSVCLLFGKCLPTVRFDSDELLPRHLCLECLSKLSQFAVFIDRVISVQNDFYQRFCSGGGGGGVSGGSSSSGAIASAVTTTSTESNHSYEDGFSISNSTNIVGTGAPTTELLTTANTTTNVQTNKPIKIKQEPVIKVKQEIDYYHQQNQFQPPQSNDLNISFSGGYSNSTITTSDTPSNGIETIDRLQQSQQYQQFVQPPQQQQHLQHPQLPQQQQQQIHDFYPENDAFCEFCDAYFLNNFELKNHIVKYHSDSGAEVANNCEIMEIITLDNAFINLADNCADEEEEEGGGGDTADVGNTDEMSSSISLTATTRTTTSTTITSTSSASTAPTTPIETPTTSTIINNNKKHHSDLMIPLERVIKIEHFTDYEVRLRDLNNFIHLDHNYCRAIGQINNQTIDNNVPVVKVKQLKQEPIIYGQQQQQQQQHHQQQHNTNFVENIEKITELKINNSIQIIKESKVDAKKSVSNIIAKEIQQKPTNIKNILTKSILKKQESTYNYFRSSIYLLLQHKYNPQKYQQSINNKINKLLTKQSYRNYLKCELCSMILTSKLSLTNHKRYSCIVNLGFSYSCRYCKTQFPSWIKMRTHSKICPCNNQIYLPPMKKQRQQLNLFNRFDKKQFEIKKLLNGRYECTICNRNYGRRSNLYRHQLLHRPRSEWTKRCHDCDKLFDMEHDLRIHLRDNHCPKNVAHDELDFTTTPALTIPATIATTTATAIIRKTPSKLRKQFICSTCDAKFSTYQKYQYHRVVHSGVKPYVCDHCSKRFFYRNNLFQHKLTHCSERNYRCTMCSKVFKRLAGLNQHVKGFHLKIKPHCCPVCKYSYALKGDMNRCKHSILKQ